MITLEAFFMMKAASSALPALPTEHERVQLAS